MQTIKEIDELLPETLMIKQSCNDWPRAFWSITWESEFFQNWGLHRKTVFYFRLIPAKSNDKITWKVKKLNFG